MCVRAYASSVLDFDFSLLLNSCNICFREKHSGVTTSESCLLFSTWEQYLA